MFSFLLFFCTYRMFGPLFLCACAFWIILALPLPLPMHLHRHGFPSEGETRSRYPAAVQSSRTSFSKLWDFNPIWFYDAVAEWIHMCTPFFGIPTRWTCLITVGCLHLIHLWNPWRNSNSRWPAQWSSHCGLHMSWSSMVCTSNFVRSTTCEIGLSEKCVPLDTLLYHVFYGHRLGYPHFQIKIAPCALSVSVSCGGLLGFGIEFQQRFFASATENEPTHWSKTDGYYM